tara:strand:- start:1063 stop:1302 length:240 start_codon:yes stop_codon:yes gene_type:complete
MSKKKKAKSKLIKDLHLDKPTSHGGWPEGVGSWNDPTPVNVQIANWLESMGLADDVPHATLSESHIRKIIREVLLDSNG